MKKPYLGGILVKVMLQMCWYMTLCIGRPSIKRSKINEEYPTPTINESIAQTRSTSTPISKSKRVPQLKMHRKMKPKVHNATMIIRMKLDTPKESHSAVVIKIRR